jgi:phosphate transport system substrate-binding protein
MRSHISTFVAAASIAIVATTAQAENLTGAGGTAIYPVLSKWADLYATKTGNDVNYQAIGSGGGIEQIEAKTVSFANTDMPLKPDDVEKNNLVQFPQVIIAITPVVNLKGVKPGELVFDGPTLADIFLGKIKEWDNPAIKKLNPKASLPHQAIIVVHRTDGSGTTFNFTNYLSKVSPEWKGKVGDDTSVSWPVGVGSKGNAGVAASVEQDDGSIGYVEYAYVIQNHMTYVDMINKNGKHVAPSMAAFQAAATNADFSKVKDFYLILTDQPGPESWPITAATYMLLRKDTPADKNHMALQFLDWCLKNGQDEARALDYIPLPADVVGQIETHWRVELPGAWAAAAK